jgi:hypothetical protein
MTHVRGYSYFQHILGTQFNPFSFQAAGFVFEIFVKVKLVNMSKLNECDTGKLIGATNSLAM